MLLLSVVDSWRNSVSASRALSFSPPIFVSFLVCAQRQRHQAPLPLDTDLQGGFPPWAFSSAADVPPNTASFSAPDEALHPSSFQNSNATHQHRSARGLLDDSPPVKVLIALSLFRLCCLYVRLLAASIHSNLIIRF